MIILRDLTKIYNINRQKRVILDHVNYIFEPGVNVGILGRNGAGKSTLIRLLGGEEPPDSGVVIRKSRVSWPLGFGIAFHGKLTGRDNLRFTCRVYGADIKKVTAFVEDFSELGSYMDMPIGSYSSGMRAKLAFGLSMAIDFDYYLIDELTAVGDASFQSKSKQVFDERKKRSTLIVVSHSLSTIRSHCDTALVLDNGDLTPCDSLAEAEKKYGEICQTAPTFKFLTTTSGLAVKRPVSIGNLT